MEKNYGPKGSAFPHLLWRSSHICIWTVTQDRWEEYLQPLLANLSWCFLISFPVLFPSVPIPSLSWDISSIFLHYKPINPSKKWVHPSDANENFWITHWGQRNWSTAFKKDTHGYFHIKCHRYIWNKTNKKIPTAVPLSQGPFRTMGGHHQKVPKNCDGYREFKELGWGFSWRQRKIFPLKKTWHICHHEHTANFWGKQNQ